MAPDPSQFSSLKHATGMYWKCRVGASKLDDLEWLRSHFLDAIARSNVDVIKVDSYRFEPQGITIMAILADSHAVLHSWPEKGYLMAEIFSCGNRSNPSAGLEYLKDILAPVTHEIREKFIQL